MTIKISKWARENFVVIVKELDADTELAWAVDVMMARAKIIYILIIKVNKLSSFFTFTSVSIEL